MKHSDVPLFFVLTLSFCTWNVLSWGRRGHAHIAMGMDLLLPQMEMSFVNASLWPDEIRGKTGWRWTAPLHYTSTDDDPPAKCTLKKKGRRPDILTALPKFYKQLIANPKDEFALGMLIHLMQDLHQPLHVSGKGRGGNDVPIRIGKRTWKLHEVWDSVIVDKLYSLYGERMVLMVTTDCAEFDYCGKLDVQVWAEESAALVCSHVYGQLNSTAFDYLESQLTVVLEQLRLATCRSVGVMRTVFEPQICSSNVTKLIKQPS